MAGKKKKEMRENEFCDAEHKKQAQRKKKAKLRRKEMAGGGHAPPPKQEELHPHPVKDQLPSVSYCITSPPPWPEAILLGFQHYLVNLGTTVLIPTYLVPQMGGGNLEKVRMMQTLQFVTGLNTLFQTFFGTRLPAVIGGSYTFVPTTISIVLAGRYSNIVDPQEKFNAIIRGIQGAMIVASTIQIVLGFSGMWRNVTRFLSPLSAAPLVALSGFGLYELGFPGYVPHLMKGERHVFDRFAVIISVVLVWIYAHLLTVGGAYKNRPLTTQISCRTDRAGLISAAPWISVPYPFQWGAPTFDAGESFAMMTAAFVALVESTGSFIAVSRYASATPIPPSILSRGIGWQGVGILFSGLFGTGNGSSVSVENAGLLALTRVGSRRVVQIAAGFMIFFAVLGKFGAIAASIPAPIVAALYCLFFAYVGSAGLSLLQFCNLNSFKTLFILAFSVFMGLSIPHYFNEYTVIHGFGPVHTHARWFNDMINVPFSSEPFVAGLIAMLLDVTLHKEDNTTKKDRGMIWWGRFRSFKTDTRSEEFYSLPFNLNKFFPSNLTRGTPPSIFALHSFRSPLRLFSSASSANVSPAPPAIATATAAEVVDLDYVGKPTATKHVLHEPLQPGVVVYDGVCHLCHRGVKWVINADKYKNIKFCCLQSQAAEPYLNICDVTREDVSRRFIFIEGLGHYHQASTAALKVLSHLPWPYSSLSSLLVVPTPLRDAVYDYVASRRYDWFGKEDECLVLKEPELLERFIDAEELWKKRNSRY
ncbi:hypothetical protein V2J09_013087 [Rumex salicifolius]